MSTLVKKLSKGLGANFICQAVNIGMQLINVPLFLHFWSKEEYGVWLMLSAVPIYFLMMDGGIVAAAMNSITMAAAKKDLKEADRIFQSAFSITTLLNVILLALSVAIIPFINNGILGSIENKFALIFLIVSTLLHLYSGLFDSIYRAADKYASGTVIFQLSGILQLLFGIIALALSSSIFWVAFAYLAGKVLYSFLLLLYVTKKYPEFHWRFSLARLKEFKPLLAPGVSWMMFRFADGLTIQGATILVGSILGGPAVALFNVYRTISRLMLQMINALGNSLWPEFSRLFGLGEVQRLKSLATKSTFGVVGVGVVLSVIVFFTSPILLKYWTHGKIEFDSSIMIAMLIYTLMTLTWYIPKVALAASNTIGTLSTINIFTAALSILIAFFGGKEIGVVGVIGGLAVGEIVIAIFAYQYAKRQMIKSIIVTESKNNDNE